MKIINPHFLFTAPLLLAAVVGLAACGGGSEPVAPVPVDRFITVTKPLLPREFLADLRLGRPEFGSLQRAGVGVKSEVCAERVLEGEFYRQSKDYLLAEISIVDQAIAELLGFALASAESLKLNFPQRVRCSDGSRVVEPVGPIADDKSITVISLLPYVSLPLGGTQGIGKRESDLLRKAGVVVKSESCSFIGFLQGSGGLSPNLYLLAEIAAKDQAKAEQVGFVLPREELLKARFPQRSDCASINY